MGASKRRLGDVSDYREDEKQLCFECQHHKCGSYCMRNHRRNKNETQRDASAPTTNSSDKPSAKCRYCRAGAGYEATKNKCDTPGFKLRSDHAITRDDRDFLKLEMKRNSLRMIQTPLHALRGWRGNCDINILLYDCHEGEPHLFDSFSNCYMTKALTMSLTRHFELKSHHAHINMQCRRTLRDSGRRRHHHHHHHPTAAPPTNTQKGAFDVLGGKPSLSQQKTGVAATGAQLFLDLSETCMALRTIKRQKNDQKKLIIIIDILRRMRVGESTPADASELMNYHLANFSNTEVNAITKTGTTMHLFAFKKSKNEFNCRGASCKRGVKCEQPCCSNQDKVGVNKGKGEGVQS